MPVPAPLGAHEKGRMLLTFSGIGRQICPGPCPAATTLTLHSMPTSACVRGGLEAQQILHSFTISRAAKPQEPEEGKVRSRRVITRELKLAAIRYTELYTPENEPKGGQRILIYMSAKDLGVSEHMLRDWRAKREDILNQKKLTCHNIVRGSYAGQEDEMEKLLLMVFKEARDYGYGISRNWFTRRAQDIYHGLCPDHCHRSEGGEWEFVLRQLVQRIH